MIYYITGSMFRTRHITISRCEIKISIYWFTIVHFAAISSFNIIDSNCPAISNCRQFSFLMVWVSKIAFTFSNANLRNWIMDVNRELLFFNWFVCCCKLRDQSIFRITETKSSICKLENRNISMKSRKIYLVWDIYIAFNF